MPCRATQDGWIMVESFVKTWSTGEGNGRPLQYSCLENSVNSMKRQKDTTLKDTHGHHQMVNTKIRLIIFFEAKDVGALYSQQKQDRELTVNSLLQNSDLNGRK